MLPANSSGQEQGLIVAALSEALRMKRNRKNKVIAVKGEFRVCIFGKQGPQGIGQIRGPMIFEAGNGFQEKSFIGSDRSCSGEVSSFRETGGA